MQLDQVQKRLLAWRGDYNLMVKEAFGATPEQWQANAIKQFHLHDKISIKSGHGVGKSTFLSWIGLGWIMTRFPAKVAVTAPTGHQLHDVLAAEMRLWARKLPPVLKEQIIFKADLIELLGGNKETFIVFRTARRENPEALQGLHSENMLFLIDEASGVEEIIFEVARGALSTEGSKVIMASNPTKTSGYFFDSFNPESIYHNITVSCHDSSLVSEQFIKDMARTYGKDSNTFRVRVLGEFPDAEDDTLIAYELVDSACGREIMADEIPPVWGLDCARYGRDDTVLIKRYGNVIKDPPIIMSQKSTMEVAGFVKHEYEKTPSVQRPDAIYIDVIGIGSGVVDRLREQGLPVVGINVAEQPRAMLGEANRMRDELWLKTAQWFESKSVALPRMELGGSLDQKPMARLVKELTGIKKGFTSAGRIKVESKDDMKKRIGRSPDVADALVLTMADDIGAIISPSIQKKYFDWKRPIERNLQGIV